MLLAGAKEPRQRSKLLDGLALVFLGISSLALGIYFWQVPTAQIHYIRNNSSPREKLTAIEEIDFINDFRSKLVGSVGTIATVVGGFVLFLNFKVAKKNFDLASRRLDIDAEKIADDKQVTETRLLSECFAKAVEQLSSDKVHVRFGGIYSLEQLTQNAPDEQWKIMEVLTAFIREESPAESQELKPSPTDVQAALTVIGRRDVQKEKPPSPVIRRVINLSSSNLAQAALFACSLQKADLSNSDLREVSFTAVKLNGAKLQKINLTKARIAGGDMSGCNLSNATLREAEIGGSSLKNADFSQANLRGARLTRLDISGAKLDGAELLGADLSQVRNLTVAQIENAYLCKTSLPKGMNQYSNRDCHHFPGRDSLSSTSTQ